MGNGNWSSSLYKSASVSRKLSGIKDFAYHAQMDDTPRDQWKAHEDLNPLNIIKSINHVRESRDSKEHPLSNAVLVFIDVTGSLQEVPKIAQAKLGSLMTYLIMKSGLTDPQVLIGGLGDAVCDNVPLQISQFESNNLVDEQLRKLVLEGGGGGQRTESYEAVLYFAARLTSIDCFEKRGKKGYLFIAGDEAPHDIFSAEHIYKLFGIKAEAVSTKQLFAEAMEKYEIFYVMPNMTQYYKDEKILSMWRKNLGENVLLLDDPNAICELIVSTIAVNEGTDLDTAIKDLAIVGDSANTNAVSKALAVRSTIKKDVVSIAIPNE